MDDSKGFLAKQQNKVGLGTRLQATSYKALFPGLLYSVASLNSTP